jgi:hypothetical protein
VILDFCVFGPIVPVVLSRCVLFLLVLLFLVTVSLILLVTLWVSTSPGSSLSILIATLAGLVTGVVETIIFVCGCGMRAALVCVRFDAQIVVVRVWQILTGLGTLLDFEFFVHFLRLKCCHGRLLRLVDDPRGTTII